MAALCIHICRFHIVCGWSSCVISNRAELYGDVGGHITGTGKWGERKHSIQIISMTNTRANRYTSHLRNTALREIKCCIHWHGVLHIIQMGFKLFLLHWWVFVCVSGEWRVATGTDYVSVILFITVGAHGVSVVDSMIYIHLLQREFSNRGPWHSARTSLKSLSRYNFIFQKPS